MRRRQAYSRVAALVLFAAVAVAMLHQHPAWHGNDKLSSCPAAAWHSGAVLKGDARPALCVAIIAHAAPFGPVASYLAAPVVFAWSSRGPPRV